MINWIVLSVSLVVIIILSYKYSQKKTELNIAKKEIKRIREEWKREQQIRNSVAGMSDSDVRERLQNIKTK